MHEFEGKAITRHGKRLMKFKPSIWTMNRDENTYLIWSLEEREDSKGLI